MSFLFFASKRLNLALELNKPLATAYYLKEELRQFWKQPDKATAEKYIHQWIKTAASTKIPMLKKFAKTVAVHKFGILNFYDHPISTGPLEGTNNKNKDSRDGKNHCISATEKYMSV